MFPVNKICKIIYYTCAVIYISSGIKYSVFFIYKKISTIMMLQREISAFFIIYYIYCYYLLHIYNK